MTNKKQLLSMRTLVICIALFAVTFGITISPMTAEAGGCGTAQKYASIATESPTKHGSEGKLEVRDVFICGTTNNESYAHAVVSMYTSGTSNFVESGIWKGYADGEQSGADLAYNMIVDNSYNIGNSHIFVDVTDEVSLNPEIDDVVKVTVYYDYNTGFPLYRDMYKVIINNQDQSHTITISDIWSNGQGYYPNTHTEILNHDSEIKSESDVLKEMSTGGTWSAWTGSGATEVPSSGNPLCHDKTDDDTYEFGIDDGGCSTS